MADNNVGLCIFSSGLQSGFHFDLKEVKLFASEIKEVKIIWELADGKTIKSDKLTEQIKSLSIDKVIIAGDYPGEVKTLFNHAAVKCGIKEENVLLADFSVYAHLNGKSTQMAKMLLMSLIKGYDPETFFVPEEVEVNTATLVIGGGIAGIQASLEIANGGNKVYLLEKTGTIGGHMAMFDKTFPTLDCAACILTPKMVEVGQHQNIEILTYSELIGLSGSAGNYMAKIHKKARRVNLATCIGCGTCTEKCPAKSSSEFDSGTSLRKAIYIPFPQAVPNKYLIDAEHCTYVQSGKCRVCEKVCPVPDCINLDEKDTEIEIEIGNIVVATGFKLFDSTRTSQFGYGKFPNVLTSLELERLINAAGPTGGNITFRTQDKKGNQIFEQGSGEPKSVAIIHCVGSRDENYNKYCSKVCCMYSLKLAHLVKEKLPEAKVFEYYIDMRAFGKGYEEFYQRIKAEGINIIRGRTATVQEKNGHLLLRSEDILNERIIEQEVDMVVLAAGLEPHEDSGKIAELLGLQTTSDGWFSERNFVFDPVGTFTGGITVAGVCQGPKDIPDTVAQASAAAAKVLQSIVKSKISKGVKSLSFSEIQAQIG